MTDVHIVKKGDSLSRIGAKYGKTVKEILALNPSLNGNPDYIQIGWGIIIGKGKSPANDVSDNVHIVKRGDTLYGIASLHGKTLAGILALNPSLKNPNLIKIGQPIKINASSKKPDIDGQKISEIVFNGKYVSVISIDNKVVSRFPAISGLPPGSMRVRTLIGKHNRNDLNLKTDYTKSKHQNVEDAGPIPQNKYTLSLKPNMPYDKSKAKGDGAGWGEGGWKLEEIGFWARLTGRFGFYLHHDGGQRGTGGCIGLKNAYDVRRLKRIFSNAEKSGQRTVMVRVKYT